MRFSQNLQEIGDNFVMGTTSLNSQFFEGKPIKEIKFRDLGVSVVLIKRGARSILPKRANNLRKRRFTYLNW